MASTLYNFYGVRVLACDPGERKIWCDRDAIDLIGEAYEQGADLLLLPLERLNENFFALTSGVARAILQKFAQYGIRLAVIGDLSRYCAKNASFRDFVLESSRRNDIWFLATAGELQDRLAPPQGARLS